jgi:hypothetical protein
VVQGAQQQPRQQPNVTHALEEFPLSENHNYKFWTGYDFFYLPLLDGGGDVAEPGQEAIDGPVVAVVALGDFQRHVLRDAALQGATKGVVVQTDAGALTIALWEKKR